MPTFDAHCEVCGAHVTYPAADDAVVEEATRLWSLTHRHDDTTEEPA